MESRNFLIFSSSPNLAVAKLYFLQSRHIYNDNTVFSSVYIACQVIWNISKNDKLASFSLFGICLIRRMKNVNRFWDKLSLFSLKGNLLKEVTVQNFSSWNVLVYFLSLMLMNSNDFYYHKSWLSYNGLTSF